MRLVARKLASLERARREQGMNACVDAFQWFTDAELISLLAPFWEGREPLTREEVEATEKYERLTAEAAVDAVTGCQSDDEFEQIRDAMVDRLVSALQPRVSRAVATTGYRRPQR